MYWQGKRVLVTGGAGFIGSHLCERLLDAGADVTVFTRYTSNGIQGALLDLPAERYEALCIIAGDLRDASGVEAAVAGQDVVFHLAAHIGIPYSYVHPNDVVQVNVNGTVNLLEACRRAGTGRIVLFSTSETYGTAQYTPIDEDHPMHPQSPYAASKVSADQIGLSYARSFDMPITICRPFNTYGPRQPARAVLPTIIVQALASEEIRLGSLTPRRDLLYVRDTAAGAMRMAEEESTIGTTLNLATGSDISIGELVDMVQAELGTDKPIVTDEARIRPEKSEVMQLMGDAGRAREMLGWAPETGLKEGIRETIAWVERNMHLFHDRGYRI